MWSVGPILWGVVAATGLLALYGLTMTALSRSWQAAVEQFQALWYLMVPLVASFGIQVGLFVQMRQRAASAAVGGTSATVGMLACCAHHATDVLPILGLSAVSVFLAAYQKPILAVSLLINIFGILWMLKKSR